MTTSIERSEYLSELAERYLSGPVRDKQEVMSTLLDGMRSAIAAEDYDGVADAVRRVVDPSLDYTTAQQLWRIRKALRGRVKSAHRVRLAVLGGFTTKQIGAFIDLCLFASHVDLDLYESDFGVFRQEILAADSALYEFQPQIVWLGVGRRDIGRRPSVGMSDDDLGRLVDEEHADWQTLASTVAQRARCQVIQNNFVLPASRPLANYEMRGHGSWGRFLGKLNEKMADRALASVSIHDVDHLAANAGRWKWDDPRFVHHAKMPCAPEHLLDYAHNVASIVGVQLGLAKKCAVLDLDNTLWGGVIGDDGVGGIRLGQGTAEGEAFIGFQEYMKALRQRGVLLAVCSKNNEETARRAFVEHPEMVLRLDDISCFVANWTDKATNLRLIAERLNIGLNSLVFIDDNPAERAIARRLVPEVSVPEMPDDVSGYVHAVDRHRFFQTLSVAAEDFQRADYYRADALRRDAHTSATDMAAFLQSLAMVARTVPISAANLERSAQLVQRSNQFNLTTRRYSAAELQELMADASVCTATVSLSDRFGDNGLISIAVARVVEDAFEIETWLMSCRVLKRGVEDYLLNHLCSAAQERGLRRVRGTYRPTAKNELVRGHYAGLGFTQVSADEDGLTVWELELNGWTPRSHSIGGTTA